MKPWLLLLLLPLLTASGAWAQAPIVATPLPPNDTQREVAAPRPPPGWLPQGTARVQALDKVNARGTMLAIKVGQTAVFGSLTIAVSACVVRPADQAADAAAFLTVTDKTPDAPGFAGWMLRSDPSLSMLAHPIYDLRVVGCGA
jgi:hypothetical protein